MKECIFCKIAAGEARASVEFENETVMAFESIDPVANTHILIIPKEHIGTFLDIQTDKAIVNDMIAVAQKLIKKLKIDDAYKLVFNGGKYQAVPHLHWHLLGGEIKPSALQET